MLTRNHSSLALPLALFCPIPLIPVIGIASHFLLDKFAGNNSDKRLNIGMEIALHLIYLVFAQVSGVLALTVFAILCLNLPDILKIFKINIHGILKFKNRLSFDEGIQSSVDLICITASVLLVKFFFV